MKTPGMAYLFWIIGLHRFYLGRPVTGIIYLLTCGGCGIWVFVDLFLIPGIVNEENHALGMLLSGNERKQTINVRVEGSKANKRKRKKQEYNDEDFDFN